ncbi:glycosyltransferase family 2 protein [Candidatus Gottesmanbacteria bacterium]|nr:glycosyltransferase family 2 protein [Candidatus Gottesmanbacteria bacterium]
MSKPLVSVVIPSFNEEKYLPRCLSSLQNQTFKNFEIIVVDNNSTDNTAQIANKFGARVVKETNQGMSRARDKGFEEAKCEIITRTDADSIAEAKWLETIYDTFINNHQLVGITGNLLSPYKKIPNLIFKGWAYFLSVILGTACSGHIYLIGPNMAVRKSAWKKTIPHHDDSIIHEDIDLSCHLSEVGKLAFIPEMKVVLSGRKVDENPLKGLRDYLLKYPLRYLSTLRIHHPFLRRHKIA